MAPPHPNTPPATPSRALQGRHQTTDGVRGCVSTAAGHAQHAQLSAQLAFYRRCYSAQARHAVAAVRAAAQAAGKAAAASATTSGEAAAAAAAVVGAHDTLRAHPSEASVQALVHAVSGAGVALSTLAAVRTPPPSALPHPRVCHPPPLSPLSSCCRRRDGRRWTSQQMQQRQWRNTT